MSRHAHRKVVALVYELTDIQNVLTGAMLLTNATASEQLATDEDQVVAPKAVAAVLRLVVERLKLVRRAMLGELNPAVLWHPENEAPPHDTDGRSPCLAEWQLPEALAKTLAKAEHLKREMERELKGASDEESEDGP